LNGFWLGAHRTVPTSAFKPFPMPRAVKCSVLENLPAISWWQDPQNFSGCADGRWTRPVCATFTSTVCGCPA
jgi:hypothetical protein